MESFKVTVFVFSPLLWSWTSEKVFEELQATDKRVCNNCHVSPHCLPFLIIHWVLLFTALFSEMLKYAQWLICFMFSIPKIVWLPNSNRFFFMLHPLKSESDTCFMLPCPISAKLAGCAKEIDGCQMLSDVQSRQTNQLFNTSIKCSKSISFYFLHRRFVRIFQNRPFRI